jgi:DNA polymerase
VKLWLDTETFSETPIKHGTYRYVADCELMVASWAVDDEPVQVIDLTAGEPTSDLELALLEADEVWAHNAMFDRNVIARHLPHVAPPIERWRCTMVKALSHSLPGGLDKLCEILQVPQDQAKHKAGKELVRLFCQPRPVNAKIRRATRETHPLEWRQFLAYAGADILAMRQIDKKMPTWNYQGAELALWHLDQRINDLGFAVDEELADASIRAIDEEQTRLRGAAWAHSDGALDSATQRDALLEHILADYNIALADLRKSTLERRLADPEIPESLKELLRIRLQASTTSTSKYRALQRGATGGRLRGTLQFNGAGRTGRWAGRTFQPQNLPRPSMDAEEVLEGIEAIKAGVAHLAFDNVMELTSNAIRGCIVAPPGRKLVVADLSNIEGRMLAWLAGEEWKLQAFRDFDAGEGEDLYRVAYARAFRIDAADVAKDQRQIGKVMELMLGYEGGVGAFLTGAATYGFDVEDLGVRAYDTIPAHILHEAGRFYDWAVEQKRPTYGLSRTAFVVCDSLKRMWREAHPNVVSLWRELEQTCIDAVANPGTTMACRRFKVRRDGAWLRIGLPSGRALCYPMPKVDEGKLSYMGVNQYTRQWGRIKTYGGKLAENVTQAAARDVLASGMPRIEEVGFQIVLTVHDELITEAPDTPDFDAPLLAQLMTDVPNFDGLPLAAAGFETYRYRKD